MYATKNNNLKIEMEITRPNLHKRKLTQTFISKRNKGIGRAVNLIWLEQSGTSLEQSTRPSNMRIFDKRISSGSLLQTQTSLFIKNVPNICGKDCADDLPRSLPLPNKENVETLKITQIA